MSVSVSDRLTRYLVKAHVWREAPVVGAGGRLLDVELVEVSFHADKGQWVVWNVWVKGRLVVKGSSYQGMSVAESILLEEQPEWLQEFVFGNMPDGTNFLVDSLLGE